MRRRLLGPCYKTGSERHCKPYAQRTPSPSYFRYTRQTYTCRDVSPPRGRYSSSGSSHEPTNQSVERQEARGFVSLQLRRATVRVAMRQRSGPQRCEETSTPCIATTPAGINHDDQIMTATTTAKPQQQQRFFLLSRTAEEKQEQRQQPQQES